MGIPERSPKYQYNPQSILVGARELRDMLNIMSGEGIGTVNDIGFCQMSTDRTVWRHASKKESDASKISNS
jgi:hypothetical protein